MRSAWLCMVGLLPVLLASCAGSAASGDVKQREATYRSRLAALPDPALRAHLKKSFPGLKHLSPPRGPESDSVLTGTEVFRVDRDFVLDVKFMYAAPYRIAAGATRLGAQAAADEGPSFWQVFGYVREASKGPWAESEHDEVLATKLRFVPAGRGR